MDKQKNWKEKCGKCWNRHKKKVLIAGSVVITVAGGYFLAKNWDDITKSLSNLVQSQNTVDFQPNTIEMVADNISESLPETEKLIKEIPVRPHLMNLPAGKTASETGKALALEFDMILGDHQTMRRGTIRHIAA